VDDPSQATSSKGVPVIHYRPFRNTDPPLVVEVWNASLTGQRTVPLANTTILEYFTLAKPFFDPAGMIFALEDDKPVGVVHAGFAANAAGTALDLSVGVICLLAVIPSHRDQGIGSELLRRIEEYLKSKGAKEILVGPYAPDNPFLFGLYGGCNSPGVLAREPLAGPFLEKRGYQAARSCGLFQRELDRLYLPNDPRTQTIRQSFDIVAMPYGHAGWWRECVLGPIEAVVYQLQEKPGQHAIGQAILWDMDPFSQMWGETCVGLIDIEVVPGFRRQGLGRYLLSQVLRHLRQQTFHLFEARADLGNEPLLNLLRSMGFQQVETGRCYRRTAL
jgi:ribosomal protein S18 acetylase RimI-like enzyme